MSAILVIGYGNELRRDDGLGPKLAAAIEQSRLSRVKVMRCHQLTPDLADPISKAGHVVFIDASVDGSSEVQVRQLKSEPPSGLLAHASKPSALLALSRALYGAAPPCWWITLPAFDLGFGEELSPQGHNGLKAGLVGFKRLWNRITEAAV